MSRQLELVAEQRTATKHKALIKALEYELVGVLGNAGATLTGFSVKIDEWQCLLTLRAILNDQNVYAHVGGDTVISCILKAVRAAQYDKLRWKEDKFVRSDD